ncbi:carbohydrate kinase family protein [Anaerolentibacter hominis]|uniref:carbohydrate kinase family protein n=1 Tax=Anaerolentibacter hominis TaxID=3079009 RepID=UPI0031B8A732
MEKREVLTIGAALADLQLRPIPRDIFEKEVHTVERVALTIGGDAINEAVVITKLGHQVTLMSMVGADTTGQFVLNHCRENGIDYSGVRVREDIDTSINVGLLSEEGVRNCVFGRQNSMWAQSIEDIDFSFFDKGYKILSFASIYNHPRFDGKTLQTLFSKAKASGMLLCVDMVSRTDDSEENFEEMKKALSYADYFFPNYGEACGMTGKTEPEEIADVFLSWGIKNVIIKTGAKGCLIKNAEEMHIVPSYSKAVCIDETGAGDNFASGFICGLLEGRSFLECAQFGCAVASIAVESIGASTGVKSREQAQKRYQEYLELIK